MKGTPLERTLDKVETDANGCWLFRGAINDMGYGVLNVGGRNVRTHRITYEGLVGSIPEGLDIDHLCRVRGCCNPEHLEPVTRSENLRRGWAVRKSTHCRNGHLFDEENLIRRDSEPWHRVCRACENNRKKARQTARDQRRDELEAAGVKVRKRRMSAEQRSAIASASSKAVWAKRKAAAGAVLLVDTPNPRSEK